jgi:hypothetical protein
MKNQMQLLLLLNFRYGHVIPSHTCNKGGDYAVKLTVKNRKGDADRLTHQLIVEEPV